MTLYMLYRLVPLSVFCKYIYLLFFWGVVFGVSAEVEPISTFTDFGESEFLVADERGYECLLYKMSQGFLFTSDGKILNGRLKLNKVRYLLFFISIYFLLDGDVVMILSIFLLTHSCYYSIMQSKRRAN